MKTRAILNNLNFRELIDLGKKIKVLSFFEISAWVCYTLDSEGGRRFEEYQLRELFQELEGFRMYSDDPSTLPTVLCNLTSLELLAQGYSGYESTYFLLRPNGELPETTKDLIDYWEKEFL